MFDHEEFWPGTDNCPAGGQHNWIPDGKGNVQCSKCGRNA